MSLRTKGSVFRPRGGKKSKPLRNNGKKARTSIEIEFSR